MPKSFVNVEVHDGIVELRSSILDERERQALRVVLAENTAGVKAVKCHLVWVEPMSGMTSSRRAIPFPQLKVSQSSRARQDEADLRARRPHRGRRGRAAIRPLHLRCVPPPICVEKGQVDAPGRYIG